MSNKLKPNTSAKKPVALHFLLRDVVSLRQAIESDKYIIRKPTTVTGVRG